MSIFNSETKNQHYVSQVEQRANASNKNASNAKQKIYKYTKNEEGQFDSGVSTKIENNLSDNDLYTLATEGKQRKNLENLMNKLESDYSEAVSNIEKSCEAHKNSGTFSPVNIEDIKKIYSLKLLTKYRNPYQIKETLKFISFTKNLILDDDRHLEALIALHKAKNNIDFLSKKYKVTKDEYISWLNTLVGLLLPVNDKSLFSGMVNDLFNAPEFGKNVFIYYYDTDSVLLPDCGILDLENSNELIYALNVTSKIFIMLKMSVCLDFNSFKVKHRTSTEMDQLIKDMKHRYPNITDKDIQNYLEFERLIKASTSFTYRENDTQMIDIFNNFVKNRSKQYYFSSSSI